MFWEKKDDRKGLPELPPIKPSMSFTRPEPEEAVESSTLPEFPSKFKAPKVREIDEIPIRKITPESSQAKTEDVYIKIDRFHSARRALNSARDKLKEIDELMRKIRETKMREEQELASWEDEIESIKSKVEDVTKNIFEKVE